MVRQYTPSDTSETSKGYHAACGETISEDNPGADAIRADAEGAIKQVGMGMR